MKTDTNGSNGIFEFRTDGRRAVLAEDVNFGGAKFSWLQVLVNQHNPANTGPKWSKIDDIAISSQGWLGCPYTVGF